MALFSGASMSWIGANLFGASDDQSAAFRRHLDTVQLPAAAATTGAATAHRLEKQRQSPRRSFGPDHLCIYEFTHSPAALDVPESGSAGCWADAYEPMWRMSWTKLSDSGTAASPDRVKLIALSPPADATVAEVIEWNKFYTEIHIGEATQRRRWTRATRWKLEHAELHPPPGCPGYCVLYEGVGSTGATDAEVTAWGAWTEGPPIWQRHVTSWTLDYRVVHPG